MKIKIKHAIPILNKERSIRGTHKHTVTHWDVIGTYMPEGSTCKCTEKFFSVTVPFDGLEAVDGELKKLVEDELEND